MERQILKSKFYNDVKNIIETARNNSYKAVNYIMVLAYWNIGRIIVEEEQKGKERAKYGTYLIKALSDRLTEDFGKGFTITNLKYMRQFFLVFSIGHSVSDQLIGKRKSHAMRDQSADKEKYEAIFANPETKIKPELSWTHYRHLLRVKDKDARKFYINEAVEGNWSTRQLERQINSFYYERILSSKNKAIVKKEAENKNISAKPEDIIKDPYVLEFLNLKENTSYLEKELEGELLNKLQQFLLELGKGFSFVSRQYRISTEDDHFYIDLVFYNYILKCFLLIDLKIGKLTHEDIGQMDFYVRYFEDKVKVKGDNPTIGLILCSEKNKTIVKYSLLNESKQIFASKYKLYLPTEKELKKELEQEIQIIKNEKSLNK